MLDLARGVLDIEANAVLALKERLGAPFVAATRLIMATRGRRRSSRPTALCSVVIPCFSRRRASISSNCRCNAASTGVS